MTHWLDEKQDLIMYVNKQKTSDAEVKSPKISPVNHENPFLHMRHQLAFDLQTKKRTPLTMQQIGVLDYCNFSRKGSLQFNQTQVIRPISDCNTTMLKTVQKPNISRTFDQRQS